MARLIRPLLEPDPDGGQVVVTRFECRTLRNLLAIRLRHFLLGFAVRRQARGFLGIKAHVDWRRCTLLSVSLWEDIESVYTIGNVPAHVRAARLTHRLGVRTTCGIYCFTGTCKRVLFRGDAEIRSPLRPLADSPLRSFNTRKESGNGNVNVNVNVNGTAGGPGLRRAGDQRGRRDDHGHDARVQDGDTGQERLGPVG
jgi:hypothetical protein